MSKTLRVANGDWYIDSRGRPIYIEDREKAAQDVANAILALSGDGTEFINGEVIGVDGGEYVTGS